MFDFGEHLKSLRKSRNLTQKQLAQFVSLSERGIQNYESNSRKPTFDIIVTLAKYFGVSTDFLLGVENNSSKSNFENSCSFPKDQTDLINNFNKLNDLGKKEANKRVSELTEIPKYVQHF